MNLGLRFWIGLLAIATVAGCAVGPGYRRPDAEVPSGYRSATGESPGGSGTNSLGDAGWWQVMKDPQLHAYISEALTNNWDVKMAAARVLQAEAAARVTRSQFFPTVAAGGDLRTTRASERGAAGAIPGWDPQRDYVQVDATMASYELDLWGRIRRANEAARARLLASRSVQEIVRQTLVSQVATSYLSLLELDYELEIARRTYAARADSLALTTAREEGGVSSLQDVRQAEILVTSAQASIADILRRIGQKENELSLLLGRNPGTPARGEGFLRQRLDVTIPMGLPSDLLDRRPDLRAAESALVAANADVGQAKAAFYPKVTLTGLYGYQSVSLSDLFTSAARTWQFGPSVSVPVFTGGALRGNLKGAKAQFEGSLAQYRQVVQEAFREVSDGLIAYERTREYRMHLEERTQAHRGATELAKIRYEGGVTSYLEVLYNEQELFSSELALAEARLRELLSVVTLYRALGGGWRTDEAVP